MIIGRENELNKDNSANIGESNDLIKLNKFIKYTIDNYLTFWQKICIKYLGISIKKYVKFIEIDNIIMLYINKKYHIYK